MITIVHGEDTTLSRKFFIGNKTKTKDHFDFTWPKITLTDLMQLTQGGSLFVSEKKIFIENLLSGKKSTQQSEIIEFIKKNHDQFDIYLWEGTEISKSTLLSFSKSSQNVFKLPQNLFIFLDNIAPNNKDNLLYFHKALENTNEELLLHMLTRQFRLMLCVLNDDMSIDEAKRLAPWQKSKILKQAKLFEEEKLISAIKKLHKIDFEQKSGQSGLNLIQAVDIFLLSL
jgi:hypothetical protein